MYFTIFGPTLKYYGMLVGRVGGSNAAPFDSLKPYSGLDLVLSSYLPPNCFKISWRFINISQHKLFFSLESYELFIPAVIVWWITQRFMFILGSFAGLGFLSWYLAGKIKVFDRKGHVAKLCIVLSPLLLAALVAVSRVDDYWHHWQDVCTGGLLGKSQ